MAANEDFAEQLRRLSLIREDQYLLTGATADIDDAITIARMAIDVLPRGHNCLGRYLSRLSLALGTRYLRTEAIQYLEEAIRIARRAVDATPQNHPDRAECLNTLGVQYFSRHSRTEALSDLEEAIDLFRGAVQATPPYHPSRTGHLSNLGLRIGDRYLFTQNITDLNEAIEIARETVRETPDSHPDYARFLGNLGYGLGQRHSHTGSRTDLDEAILISRKAVETTHPNSPDLLWRMCNLGTQFHSQYLCTEVVTDLDRVIDITRQAIEATDRDHPERFGFLGNLVLFLNERFSRTAVRDDLEQAISTGREVVQAMPENHPTRSRCLSNLGLALRSRYSCTGTMKDLEETITVAREALRTIPHQHYDLASALHNLAVAIGERYSHTGAMGDLDEAISISQQAIETTPIGHPDRAGRLNSLANRVGQRYSRNGGIIDLEQGISAAEEAAETGPIDHPNRAGYLCNLGNHLHDRYLLTGAADDLEKAVTVTREAVENTPHDHPKRASYLSTLGSRLGDWYSRTGVIADLDEAIKIANEAISSTAKTHIYRAGRLINLGLRLLDRYNNTMAENDLQESKNSFIEAFHTHEANISYRLRAARHILSMPNLLHDPRAAHNIAEAAVNLIPLLSPLSLQSTDKQYQLRQVAGLASDAAALALLVDHQQLVQPASENTDVIRVDQVLLSAIRLLETGRSVIASSLQDIRTDLSSLQGQLPELAQSFVELRNMLDRPASGDNLDAHSLVRPPYAAVDQRHQASSRMSTLLDEIRRQPGFETFLMAATEAQMRTAAAHGPFVIINVSQHRCDALIIEQAGIRVVELEQLTQDEILSKAGQIKSLETLSWLWTAVAKPVLDALGFTKTLADNDSWPRVWWIPTGSLVRFPIHAAGHHLQGNSETVLDRVVSSYASSIKSIINTRQQGHQKPPVNLDSKVVLVAMQETPAQSVLHHAVDEVDTIESICASRGVPYHQPHPSQQAVLNDLETCRIFHFAGHGSTHTSDPLQSRLLLKDWQDNPLSVEIILDKINLQATSPFLAYLSACGTGQVLVDKSLDESIHLTSAFQLAGFRHVIGTLWEVDDALCVDMARMTYEYMSEKGFSDESVSCGLHRAARRLRDEWVSKLERSEMKLNRDAVLVADTAQGTPTWVPYVHYGV
ncbi:hypothetical protein CMEL01_16559 [Colletotrichum melonis]|uniref:CHAT domain-containing protein n=1 Tax=Colletotrichum melonis TaxID=1209925 RepID=A0AAI9UFQ2_9PEZI|nr:hypothetical protein CMEL01_16559 [Colletotrichum melonis]